MFQMHWILIKIHIIQIYSHKQCCKAFVINLQNNNKNYLNFLQPSQHIRFNFRGVQLQFYNFLNIILTNFLKWRRLIFIITFHTKIVLLGKGAWATKSPSTLQNFWIGRYSPQSREIVFQLDNLIDIKSLKFLRLFFNFSRWIILVVFFDQSILRLLSQHKYFIFLKFVFFFFLFVDFRTIPKIKCEYWKCWIQRNLLCFLYNFYLSISLYLSFFHVILTKKKVYGSDLSNKFF
jgi:hypothetical protein